MYKEYRSIQKKKDSRSEVFKVRESEFIEKLKLLFDISQKDAMENLDESTKTFLLGQRSSHRFGLLDTHKNLTDSAGIN